VVVEGGSVATEVMGEKDDDDTPPASPSLKPFTTTIDTAATTAAAAVVGTEQLRSSTPPPLPSTIAPLSTTTRSSSCGGGDGGEDRRYERSRSVDAGFRSQLTRNASGGDGTIIVRRDGGGGRYVSYHRTRIHTNVTYMHAYLYTRIYTLRHMLTCIHPQHIHTRVPRYSYCMYTLPPSLTYTVTHPIAHYRHPPPKIRVNCSGLDRRLQEQQQHRHHHNGLLARRRGRQRKRPTHHSNTSDTRGPPRWGGSIR